MCTLMLKFDEKGKVIFIMLNNRFIVKCHPEKLGTASESANSRIIIIKYCLKEYFVYIRIIDLQFWILSVLSDSPIIPQLF
jgi:hypothetical protein